MPTLTCPPSRLHILLQQWSWLKSHLLRSSRLQLSQHTGRRPTTPARAPSQVATPCMVSALPPPVAGAAPSLPQPCVESCRLAPDSTASNKQPPGGSFFTLHYSLIKMLRKMKMCATVAFSQFCTPSRGLVLISGGSSSVASRKRSAMFLFQMEESHSSKGSKLYL